MKTLVVIGAGVSGLVPAKEALEAGLRVVVLEKSDDVGGLWHPKTGAMWDSMTTNLSKFTGMYSDFPWPEDTQAFPKHNEVYRYLKAYAKHFEVLPHIRFRSRVTQLDYNKSQWLIRWRTDAVDHEQISDGVIVATGVFSQPYLPRLPGAATFTGSIKHSSCYRSPEEYRDKVVLVVGSSFSGCEIASDLVGVAKSIIHVSSRPYWVMPRYYPTEDGVRQPIDLVRFTRQAGYHSFGGLTSEEINQAKNRAYFERVCPEQKDVPALAIEKDSTDSPFFTLSDRYLPAVKRGLITVVRGCLLDLLDGHATIALPGEESQHVDVDTVVMCTGFRLNLDYLSQALQEKIAYQADDSFQPICLYESVFHPRLPGFACVGMIRGPHWAIAELQARWAVAVMSGLVALPELAEMEQGIKKELALRALDPKPQFAHANYIRILDTIAKHLGVLPDFETIKEADPNLYKTLWEGAILPVHFRLFGLGKQPALARQVLASVAKDMKARHAEQTAAKALVKASVLALGARSGGESKRALISHDL